MIFLIYRKRLEREYNLLPDQQFTLKVASLLEIALEIAILISLIVIFGVN